MTYSKRDDDTYLACVDFIHSKVSGKAVRYPSRLMGFIIDWGLNKWYSFTSYCNIACKDKIKSYTGQSDVSRSRTNDRY
jgi:hypothetical protein